MASQYMGSEYRNDEGESYILYKELHGGRYIAEANNGRDLRDTNRRKIRKLLKEKGFTFVGFTPLFN